jgi:hypothetical protein
MTRLLRLTAVFVLTAPLLVAAGCKQKAGERCQVQSDCDDNLICVLPAGATPQSGGTCQNPNAEIPADMATPTPGADMAGTTPPADMTQVSTSD